MVLQVRLYELFSLILVGFYTLSTFRYYVSMLRDNYQFVLFKTAYYSVIILLQCNYAITV